MYAVINSGIGYDRIVLPQITIDEATKDIDVKSISYFDYPDYNYRITNIVSLNLNTQEVQQKSYLIGDSGQLYASEHNLYITHQHMLQPYDTLQEVLREVMPLLPVSAVQEIKEIQSIGLSKQDTYEEIMLVIERYSGNRDSAMPAAVIAQIQKIVPPDIAEQIYRIKSSRLSSDKKTEFITKVFQEYLTSLTLEERNKFEARMQEQFSTILQETQKNQEIVRKAIQDVKEKIERRQEQTRIHKISLNNGKVQYQASNSVPGRVLNQYSMDEYQNVFRIATTAGWQGSESNVYTLDKNLERIGSLEGLAPGEQIYSARFMGPKAYLVTFKQVDPLFVIDLSNPTTPRVLGKLKIPGFSNYLHPYDETHLIGIGRDADETGRSKGLKIGLFDVSNVEQPKEVAKYVLPQGSDSEALYEPKAILFSYERNLLVLPVTQYNWAGPIMASEKIMSPEPFTGVYAFEITPKSIGLKGKISHGTDWNQNIRRSMFIKNTLFTISESTVLASSMTDFTKIARVELNAELCGDGICDSGEKECAPCYAEICPMVCLPNPNYCEKDCRIIIK